MERVSESLLQTLVAGAGHADISPDWPGESWEALTRAGVLAWGVPREYGGRGLSAAEQAAGHAALAGACLTMAFILSQREAALRRVLASPSESLRRKFLPALATGDCFLTVGLSQLTTSRQHGAPALMATPEGAGFRLDGEAPWVTGADQADALVLGAVLPGGRQALFAVPAGLPGLSVGPPLPLAALAGSRTAAVRCDGVRLGAEWLLGGPAERVLGSGGGGGLETSTLALGLAGAAVRWLSDEAKSRPELATAAEAFAAEHRTLRALLEELAALPSGAEAAQALRVRATLVALRSTQAALTSAKGTGFVAPHPAARWARQALFFLVWSCPRPVGEGILAELLPATTNR